jgi:hypothetical protein
MKYFFGVKFFHQLNNYVTKIEKTKTLQPERVHQGFGSGWSRRLSNT